jgi:hypothetical protein
MLALDFIRWWYGPGWIGVSKAIKRRLATLAAMFSVSVLLQTLFSPWRRIMTYPGNGLVAHLQALGDNIVSRCVGFVVRVMALLAAGGSFVAILVFGLVQFIVWPFLPFIAIGAIAWGLL